MESLRFPIVLALTAALLGCSSSTGPDLSQMSFSDEPLIGKFVWYDLITDDAEAARTFYSGLFGWSFDRREGPGGNDYFLVHDDGRFIAGMVAVDQPPDGSEHSRWLPYVSVADVDASTARARDAGGRVVVEPLDVRLGRVSAIVDPEGAAIGLARSTIGDPDDETTAGGPGRIVWAELLAGDDAAAAAFYRTVIGCETRTIDRRGGRYTLLVGGGTDRAGIFPNPTDWDPQWITHFGVADPAVAAARAEELGGTVLLAPTPEVREGSIAIVSDPSGSVLVLSKWSS